MNRKALRRIPLDKLMDLKVDYGATCSATTGLKTGNAGVNSF